MNTIASRASAVFTVPVVKKGENFELRAELNSEYRIVRKDAIKRVIANMTVGKDVSGLFTDVLKNMQTDDLEQKKLVYLYLMNYAKTQPELVILAVNTFVKDTQDSNPLVRALAIRTMGCLRAEKIIDYISEPLSQCLKDENPYVRKTAALCVAKLYDLNAQLCHEGGFIDMLREMLGDNNPMVVANTVTALVEIHDSSKSTDPNSKIFILNDFVLSKLLVALNECTEWGRIAILSALSRYRSTDEKECEKICERVLPQFQHANASVVLGAVRIIMLNMNYITREEFSNQLVRKMTPPLVTLISSSPEVQWVALRNINLILQKRPDILASEIRVFFIKYTDPPYVKIEKLEIMVRLASSSNIDTLLSELKEYASEADVEFVRKAVRAIGKCAVKIEDAAERCVNVLLDLIKTRVSYVVQESVVVLKDVFRKYPSEYEGIIPFICSNIQDLDEPEAIASLIWILGEYAEKIENADVLLSGFMETFLEDSPLIQLQLVTAIVKLYLKRPDDTQGLVQKVLSSATKDCDSPDVRDRAYIYWRLLSTDPGAAKSVVLATRPPIFIPTSAVSPQLLEELISEIGTLASVYHKPHASFIGHGKLGVDTLVRDSASRVPFSALETVLKGQKVENLLDMDEETPWPTSTSHSPAFATFPAFSASKTGDQPNSTANPLNDLLNLFDSAGNII